MPSKEKVKIIKSPTSPVRIRDYNIMIQSNKVVYYVKLSNGLIATSPDNYPSSETKEEEKD